MIEEKLSCKTIRTNSDAPDFNIYRLINQIRMNIKQLAIKSTHWINSLIDDLSKTFLGLELSQSTQ